MKRIITWCLKNGAGSCLCFIKTGFIKASKVGIATFVMRNKDHQAILKATPDVLILNQLLFSDEIRDKTELAIAASPVKPGELKMVISLINQLSGKFNIGTYKDTYTSQLLKLIKV